MTRLRKALEGEDSITALASTLHVLVQIGNLLGYDEQKLLHGGALDEILVAAAVKVVASPHIQGVDAVDPKTGQRIELKHSRPRLTVKHPKTNIVYTLPASRKTETCEAYVERVESEALKIDLHQWVVSLRSLRHLYTLDGRFMARLLAHYARENYEKRRQRTLNFGAVVCQHCKGVHRLDAFQKASQRFLDETHANSLDWPKLVSSLVDVEVPSQCGEAARSAASKRAAADRAPQKSGASKGGARKPATPAGDKTKPAKPVGDKAKPAKPVSDKAKPAAPAADTPKHGDSKPAATKDSAPKRDASKRSAEGHETVE